MRSIVLRTIIAASILLAATPFIWYALSGEKVVERLTFLATLLLALVTFSLFVATLEVARQTAGLGFETAQLAKDTVKANDLAVRSADAAERHHRETLRPLIWQNVRLDCTRDGRDEEPWIFRLSGQCVNIGLGPAKKSFAFVDIVGFVRCVLELGPMSAGERRDVDQIFEFNYSTEQAEDTFDRWPRLSGAPLESLRNWPFVIRTVYWSIFDDEQPWQTKQRAVTGTLMAMERTTHEPTTVESFFQRTDVRFFSRYTRNLGEPRGKPVDHPSGPGHDALNFD